MKEDILTELDTQVKNFLDDLNEKEEYSLNELLVPTFRWLKVNELKINNLELPSLIAYKKEFLKKNSDNSKILIEKMSSKAIEGANYKGYASLEDKYGIDKNFVRVAETAFNAGVLIHASRNSKLEEPVRIDYNLDSENPVIIEHNIIVAEEDSEVTLILDYRSEDEAKGFHDGVTKVFAKNGSKVNVIKIQRFGDKTFNLDSNVSFVEQDAKVNWITVELGSKTSVSNYLNNLNETASESNLYSLYFADKDKVFDLNYTMIHRGRKTLSNIEARGVLKDNSKKIFKGTVDFKLGAKRAKAVEEEYTLLLDPTAKSDSVPALLCEEEDVDGEHAASAGQIDENQLFYLMSRGLSEQDAKKLIVEASFKPILDKIPSESLRDIINDEVHRRLKNE